MPPLIVTVGSSLMPTLPLVKCLTVSSSVCHCVDLWVCILVRSSSDNVPSKMLDVIGYFVSQLAMVDINSLAGGSHYSQPCVVPFLPHEEELYNKLVSLLQWSLLIIPVH